MRDKQGRFTKDPNKSYVSMETNVCVVCGKEFDTGSILLDKRLRDSMEHHTCTGLGMCPEHLNMFKDGFIALVEVDPSQSAEVNGVIQPGEEYRTGTVVHLKRKVFNDIFTVEAPEKGVAFIPPEITTYLEHLKEEASD